MFPKGAVFRAEFLGENKKHREQENQNLRRVVIKTGLRNFEVVYLDDPLRGEIRDLGIDGAEFEQTDDRVVLRRDGQPFYAMTLCRDKVSAG